MNAPTLIAAVVALTISPSAPQGWKPHMGEPPYDRAMWDSAYALLEFSGIRGALEHDLKERQISVFWELETGESLYQKFPVSYFPTAVAGVSAGKALIAGKRGRNGNTVVELWKLSMPVVLHPNPPGSAPAVIQPSTIESVDTLYDEATQGRDMIRLMSTVRHSTNKKALLQFHDSRQLWVLDYSDLSNVLVSLLASPLQGAPLTITSLGNTDYTLVYRGNHTQEGQLYFFGFSHPFEGCLVLSLIDSNRDGIIDGFSYIPEADWGVLGYGALNNYLDFD